MRHTLVVLGKEIGASSFGQGNWELKIKYNEN
jgi:hypothetical protein